MEPSRKQHWENVYESKQPHEVSWTQAVPGRSLEFIRSFGLSKDAAIIDIGGGDSLLADHLLEEGYTNITVLDISSAALERAKKRLGEKSSNIRWIISDISEFMPDTTYELWHDRAAFHFLVQPEQVAHYVAAAENAVTGYMIIGTFAANGPLKCSGLDVRRYDGETLESTFAPGFLKLECIEEAHATPFSTVQQFLFCSFKKMPSPSSAR